MDNIFVKYNFEPSEGLTIVQGERGFSAYDIAVQNGFVGTEQEWLDRLKGVQIELVVSNNGQINFTLPITVGIGNKYLLVNSIRYPYSDYFTISGATLTWLNNEFELSTTDKLIFIYY